MNYRESVCFLARRRACQWSMANAAKRDERERKTRADLGEQESARQEQRLRPATPSIGTMERNNKTED